MSLDILVTGCAGFIGFHVCKALLDQGHRVIGIDNLNPYYDVKLKQARLQQIQQHPRFAFHPLDIADHQALEEVWHHYPGIMHVIHLAAQAGVRYSLTHPRSYIRSNIDGHLNILEIARARPGFQHLVYASSSSVYGANQKTPFSTNDPVDHPISLYAATKRSDELMSFTYAHLFNVPATGLRFFTVYGPWGRPDMAYFSFTRDILAGKPITLFNHGQMRRDFTYIDDVVSGVLAALHRPPKAHQDSPPHRVFNLGNSRAESLGDFVATLEELCAKKATINFAPMQPGDVPETFADTRLSQEILGYQPHTPIQEGLAKFVAWYRHFYSC
ncbi:MAG: NAD-dependent epimerase/dehydratase family protein [Holosporales bacterium]